MTTATDRGVVNSLHRIMKANDPGHRGYSYFVLGNSKEGYRWELVDAAGAVVGKSETCRQWSDCMQTLRTAQRHAATKDVRDESTK